MAMKVAFLPWMEHVAIDGAKRVGNTLVFDQAKTEQEVKTLFNKAGRDNELGLSLDHKAVSGDELAMLKSQFPNLNFDSGKVFKCVAANTKLDRDVEQFSREILELFAKQINAKPVTLMWQHDRETHGLGRMFGASVNISQGGQDFDLVAHILVSNEARIPDQGERKLAPAVEDQYVTDVSIGFRAWGEYKEVMVNGENRYIYTYGIDPQRPETKDAYIREISFVDFGAQVGAQTFKAANHQIEFIKENKTMTKTVNIEIGGVQHAIEIEATGDAITVKGVEVAQLAIKTATDAATAKIDGLQKSVDLFRAPIEADVVNAKIAGLDTETVKSFAPEKLIATAQEVAKAVIVKQPEPEKAKPIHDFSQLQH